MSNLILPSEWTSQPQVPVEIDWGSPLVAALGLTEVWYPRNGLASKTLIRGFTPTAYVPSAVAVGYSENGAGARFLSNTQNNGIAIASSADDIFPDLTQASIFVMRKSADTVLRASTLFGAGVTVGSNNRIILHAPYSDGITWFEYGDNTTTNKISIGGTVKTTNTEKFALIAGPRKGREIWRNGVKVIGDTSKNAARISNTNPFRIGSVGDNPTVPSDIETVSLVIIGKKEWPDWAIKTLSDNPWQIFKAPRRQLFAVTAGGLSHTSTGTLTGQGATVAGVSAHISKHATTGALTGSGTTVAGIASSATNRTSTGALIGAGAVVTGTASSATVRTSSGALVGAGAAVSGTASSSTARASSGALTGAGAVVAGTAALSGGVATHDTSGTLAGHGATVAGTAARSEGAITHFATGALIGDGATVAGTSSSATTRTSSGDLIGAGSIVSGVASSGTIRTSSGTLAGAGAVVAGAASRASSGAVVTAIINGQVTSNRFTGPVTSNRFTGPVTSNRFTGPVRSNLS